jgi:hypothetical protein
MTHTFISKFLSSIHLTSLYHLYPCTLCNITTGFTDVVYILISYILLTAWGLVTQCKP